MRRGSCLLILLFLMPHILPVTAGESPGRRNLYVRQTVGDDAHDGLSPATAWSSLSMLETALQAGDTVYVGPGLYREAIVVEAGGTAEQRITFIADSSGRITGDPPGVVMITGADAVEESIFTPHSSPGVYSAPNPEGPVRGAVEMDGPQYRYTAWRDTWEHIREGMSGLDVVAKLPSTFFYDSEAKVVYLHTSDGKPPQSHEMELIRRNDGIASFGKHYLTVEGFTFRHMAVAGINFDKASSHCVARDNTSYGAWQGIRVFNSHEVLVSGNTLFRNGNSGAYFFGGSTHGSAIGNVLYENAKGVRWSSDSSDGRAIDNVAFVNHEVGISIENADDIRVSGNVLVGNAVAQLGVKTSRFVSQGNCFETRGPGQLIAKIDFKKRYGTLAGYQDATNQDRDSRTACGDLPERVDVHRLHAETLAYAERARKALPRDAGTLPPSP